LARSPVSPRYTYSLEALLEELEIPFANLHSSGNDAHFILRALLMLAVRYAEGQQKANLPDWVRTAREISQAPRPLTKAEKMEIPEAKRKLQRKTNKKKKRGGVPAAVAEEARGETPGANTP
jgi:DNA polymerase III epsilon subunit-like protein